jgi:AcrR family transcriptional regulator
MAARKPLARRKLPGQERSKETVEAILEATARILSRDGYDRTSTNKIADAAGVSIGSLYQYFPNKDALVGALLERYASRLIGLIETSAVELAAVPLEQATEVLVRAVFAFYRRAPRLHRVLFEQITNAGNVERRNALLRHAHQLFLGYFERHRAELRVDNLDVATFAAMHAIEGIAHAAVLSAPERLEDDALVDESVAMLLSYLQKPR